MKDKFLRNYKTPFFDQNPTLRTDYLLFQMLEHLKQSEESIISITQQLSLNTHGLNLLSQEKKQQIIILLQQLIKELENVKTLELSSTQSE